jgi:tRNA-specific 2-thiouridylase
MNSSKRVLVAMSGGVDSSVTAFLLKKEGYDVTGVTFNLYQQENPQHIIDAKKAAEIIGVPHIVMHLEEMFSEKIINYFTQTYLQGKTPNPCALCNKYIKFASLEQKADELGIDLIATGHYSELALVNGNKRPTISTDENKSQEYFLALVPQKVLNRIIFPLHEFKKPTVRQIARENNLKFFGDKPDSQEVCFLQNKSYIDYLEKTTDLSSYDGGNIVSESDNKVLGQHKGFFRYTVGQRRGIGVGIGKPQYVTRTNPLTNEIFIGEKEQILKKYLKISLLNILDPIELDQEYKVKIRYKSKNQPCKVVAVDNNDPTLITIEAQDHFNAPSNGQIAVFYNQNNIVIAGGEILESM